MKRRTRKLILEATIVAIILVTLTILIIPNFIAAQSINTPKHFPDPNFRRAVEKQMGVGPNGPFTAEEASKIKGSFYCLDKFIKDMTGIEYFPSLNHLDCQANQIEKLDLSKNRDLLVLHCGYNKIKEINVSQNFLLEEIICPDNQLNLIDVSHNINLKSLNIMKNYMEELDISHNEKLTSLMCTSNNLNNIDLINNQLLINLDCGSNNISKLNLTTNLFLRNLSCYKNQLTKLDLRGNKKIKSLDCRSNQITDILLPNKSDLLTVKCSNNCMKDISEILKLKFFQYLDVRHNNLDIKQLEGAREMLKNMYQNGFTTKGVEYLPQQNIGFADTPKSWQGDFKE
jgi:hypothetical protein